MTVTVAVDAAVRTELLEAAAETGAGAAAAVDVGTDRKRERERQPQMTQIYNFTKSHTEE